MVQIDSHYYGGVVIAPLNIVLYNVFSDHGPDIYGKPLFDSSITVDDVILERIKMMRGKCNMQDNYRIFSLFYRC